MARFSSTPSAKQPPRPRPQRSRPRTSHRTSAPLTSSPRAAAASSPHAHSQRWRWQSPSGRQCRSGGSARSRARVCRRQFTWACCAASASVATSRARTSRIDNPERLFDRTAIRAPPLAFLLLQHDARRPMPSADPVALLTQIHQAIIEPAAPAAMSSYAALPSSQSARMSRESARGR